jgi:hypothetical protein
VTVFGVNGAAHNRTLRSAGRFLDRRHKIRQSGVRRAPAPGRRPSRANSADRARRRRCALHSAPVLSSIKFSVKNCPIVCEGAGPPIPPNCARPRCKSHRSIRSSRRSNISAAEQVAGPAASTRCPRNRACRPAGRRFRRGRRSARGCGGHNMAKTARTVKASRTAEPRAKSAKRTVTTLTSACTRLCATRAAT